MSYTFLRGHRLWHRRFIVALTIIFGLAFSRVVPAVTVAGLDVPDSLQLQSSSASLRLNGAGIRYKWFFKIYVAALYLPQPARQAERILSADTARAVSMHFLYEEVSAEKMREAWTSGVKNNTSEKEFAALQSRLKTFNAFFPAVMRGDTVRLEFVPAQGTTAYLNGKKLGAVPGEDFARAILAVWLGEVPIDQDLKASMLGR